MLKSFIIIIIIIIIVIVIIAGFWKTSRTWNIEIAQYFYRLPTIYKVST